MKDSEKKSINGRKRCVLWERTQQHLNLMGIVDKENPDFDKAIEILEKVHIEVIHRANRMLKLRRYRAYQNLVKDEEEIRNAIIDFNFRKEGLVSGLF